ncbi:xanthine dehydrogenase family protein molybdopterin-binding subunit [Alicyclobacillus shizuokensis]|uniref:xanthine dehydrogenase family protein molybdopterin-binding subunit n=1 Tax=Alicyclobacillus shizuokensis TaxID=392014 RepID=UPI000833A884|nr:molybdopterin cofactor-binding domain-containing protein [Alicyclobacillus shizuokensis]MCL6626256.1 molybdopterin-dependent oxidoreductase [Alicyclobacillus shizuokensis]
MSTVFGQVVKRREDPRFITGRGQYTDDVQLPGMLYAAILRSPHAHARIIGIDVEAAKRAPGVVAVYTGRDLAERMGSVPTAWIPPESDLKTPPHRALAVDKVRYVGDGVAMVIADTRYAARDALDLISVQYEVLPAVVNQVEAMENGAPVLHAEAPDNVAFHWQIGNATDEVFAQAEVVVRHTIRQQRLVPNPMEPRASVAQYNPATGELTVWVTSQNPHIHRFVLSGILGIPEHRLRVVATDVGGGFGAKIAVYPDEALVAFAAMDLGRPVKWTEDRREHFLVTTHGRDHVEELELAGTRDGRIQAIRVRAYANMGAYLSTAAPGVPTILFGLIVPGPYTIPYVGVDVYGVFTNTTPTDAYRGAGRPEATYLLERMVDLYAREIRMDPVEVRRRNLIPADEFPYHTPTGLEYDSGNYHLALSRALDMADYDGFRRKQQELRAQGRHVGVGVTTYVEICGLGPSQVAGAVGFQGGLWESSTVRVHPTGKVTVFTGSSPHGQGEETTFAQIVADKLGVLVEDVEVVHGDTARISMGWGTYGSRTTPVAGSALAVALDRVLEKARRIAAHMLEVSAEDVECEDGRFYAKGAKSRSVSFQDVALQAHLAWNLPQGVEPSLEAQAFYDPANFTYSFGTHICMVEVDTDTGDVRIDRYIAVDDCGRVINPMIAEGQVHGGIVQGIGQALWEGAVYDEQGQLVTGTLMDYAMPKARFFPNFETAFTETPSPHNPLGVKGIGETGTIAATPTVVNAVLDALAPFGVREIQMPLTPERVWRSIQEGGQRS